MSESTEPAGAPNLAPPRPPSYPPALVGGGEDGQPNYWTNLRAASRRDRALITQCMTTPSAELDSVLGERLYLVGVLAHRQDMVDKQSGEIVQRTRIVLALEDGSIVATMSEGIRKGLGLILMLEGSGPWPAPLPIRIEKAKTNSGFWTYNVVLLDDAPDGPDPASEAPKKKPKS